MDLAVVDALARLEVQARRAGLSLVIAAIPEDLRLLVSFCGLDDALRLEARRQPEQREERRRVEEEAELGDAAVDDVDDL
jgi:hypothetical protein